MIDHPSRPPSRTPLTPPQVALLDLLSRGYTRDAAAERLHLSINTVKSHMRLAFASLGVGCVAHAIRVAFERGLLRLDPVVGDDTEVLPTFTHTAAVCAGEPCCLHAPSDHALRAWPRRWRVDRRLMERRCPHGIGHPDPDHVAHVARTRGADAARVVELHGCDGCCRVSDDGRDADR